MMIIGHISDAVAKTGHGLLAEGKVLQVKVKANGKHRDAPEGTWEPRGGIDLPCNYLLYGANVHESRVWEKIKQFKRDLIFFKNVSIHFDSLNPY